MKKWVQIPYSFCFLACLALSPQASAALFNPHSDEWSHEVNYDGSWYMNVGIGGTFPSIQKSYYIPTAPGWPNDHYVQTNDPSAVIAAIGAGYAVNRMYQNFLPYISLGLNASYDFFATASGYIEQYSQPSMRNYNYTIDVHRQTFLGLLKVDLVNYNNIMPYLSVGAGYSLNKLSGYRESPLQNVTPRISPGFRESTNGYFAYTFGAGLDYMASNNIWMSVDYNYGFFGYARTSTGDNPASLAGNNYSNAELRTKLNANTVMFTVTFMQSKI